LNPTGGRADPLQLSGRTEPWGLAGTAVLVGLVAIGLWLRLRGLSSEGFADDEVHKWLAANRYLSGDFGGDDVEHPMLMKLLTAGVAALPVRWAPEIITRVPSAVAGGLTVWATALLGRRLFGRPAGLIGAGLLAFSTTAIGYHRIAKEDVLLGLFLTLCMWCLAEAKAMADGGRPQESRRWEVASAAALGAAFASKYFIFYFLIPVLSYVWLRSGSAWRVPFSRWLVLLGVALAVFLALNWAPLLPGSLDYMAAYIRGDRIGSDRGVSESILFMGRLSGNLAFSRGEAPTPAWFYGAFAAFKFAPLTGLFAASGLAYAVWRRTPSHRIPIVWLAVFQAFTLVAGARYGRFFVSAMPPFVLLSAHAASLLAGWVSTRFSPVTSRAREALAGAAAGLLLVVPEARAAVAHAPHHRLYLNSLAGGDANIGWFLPHCDYFDAGVREALAWVAEHAEPGAEISSEVDWTVRFYADRAGRRDVVSTPILPGKGCATGRPCYVVVQVGRLYLHNRAALERLAARVPVHTERIGDQDVVRVYRLDPGEALFP